MQDFPKLLVNNEKVGFSSYEKWFCFTTCKNNLKDGCDKLKKGISAETAFSEEQDIYNWNIKILKDILGKLTIDNTEPELDLEIEGTHVKFGPKIIIYPSFASTVSELKDKVKANIKVSNNSTLILKGDFVLTKDVDVDGIAVIDDKTKDFRVTNKQRHVFDLLKPGEGKNYEQIRGYSCYVSN